MTPSAIAFVFFAATSPAAPFGHLENGGWADTPKGRFNGAGYLVSQRAISPPWCQLYDFAVLERLDRLSILGEVLSSPLRQQFDSLQEIGGDLDAPEGDR